MNSEPAITLVKQIHEHLDQQRVRLELSISVTLSSVARNALTDANIHLASAIAHLTSAAELMEQLVKDGWVSGLKRSDLPIRTLVRPTTDDILTNQLDMAEPRDEVEVIIDTTNPHRKVTINIGPAMAVRIGRIDNLVVRRGDGVLLARVKHGETLFNPLLPGNMS